MFPFQAIKKTLRVGTQNDSARAQWVERKLQEVPGGQRILDAGAGPLRYKPYCSHLKYVSQDFAQYDGVGDGKGLQTGGWDQTRLDIVSDITAIPEPDGSFDAILCVEVFEHLPNAVLAIAEFSRLLRRGGQLIVTVPFNSLTHFAPYHFCTGFSRYFFEKHLPAHEFEIREITLNGNYFEVMGQELRRTTSVARQYTDSRPRPWEYLALYSVLRMLQRFSSRDAGSRDLACFGIQVHAIKK